MKGTYPGSGIYFCSKCSKTFARKFNLNRHVETLHGTKTNTSTLEGEDHSENEYSGEREFNLNRRAETLPRVKNSSIMDADRSEDEYSGGDSEPDTKSEDSGQDERSEPGSEALEDNAVFLQWLDNAKDATQQARTEKYEKYVSQGVDEGEATEKAYLKTIPDVKSEFFAQYETFLWQYNTLEHDDVHQEISEELGDKMDSGVNIRHAIKRSMAKHKHEFEGLFQYEEKESENEEGDESS